MITINILVNVGLTSLILYFMLNTYFHYHVIFQRQVFIFIVILFLFLLNTRYEGFVIGDLYFFILLQFLPVSWYLIDLKKHRNGYLLLGVTKKNFTIVNQIINEAKVEYLTTYQSLCYNVKKSYLLILDSFLNKERKKLLNSIEKSIYHYPRKIEILHGVLLVLTMIIIALIWRF